MKDDNVAKDEEQIDEDNGRVHAMGVQGDLGHPIDMDPTLDQGREGDGDQRKEMSGGNVVAHAVFAHTEGRDKQDEHRSRGDDTDDLKNTLCGALHIDDKDRGDQGRDQQLGDADDGHREQDAATCPIAEEQGEGIWCHCHEHGAHKSDGHGVKNDGIDDPQAKVN